MPYAKFTDPKGDYVIRISDGLNDIYQAIGATIVKELSDLSDVSANMTSAAEAKRNCKGIDIALTIKIGTGSSARWVRRIIYCPVDKLSTVTKVLPGKAALGGLVSNAYFPRRRDFI